MDYLALPLLLRDGYLPRTDLYQSIIHAVGLLLSTRVGTMPFFPDYGCDLWDKEYADTIAANKGDIRASLRNAIAVFEKRLYNTSVSIAQEDTNSPRVIGLKVKVTGNYRDESGEEQKFEAAYNLG
jgi:phage baseplate assembly protein W